MNSAAKAASSYEDLVRPALRLIADGGKEPRATSTGSSMLIANSFNGIGHGGDAWHVTDR
jgi:hypothetical protein